MAETNSAVGTPQGNHNFLFSATDPDGDSVTERISSNSLAEARQTLESEGYTTVVFHTSEADTALNRWLSPDGEQHEELEDIWDPALELESRQRGGTWASIAIFFKSSTIFWMPLVLWNTYGVMQGPPYGWLSLLGFALGALFMMYSVWAIVPSLMYERLVAATTWARWQDVRRWVGRIRWLQRFIAIPIPDLELDKDLALAAAAEGNLSEAVSLMQKYEHDSSIPQAMFHSYLSSIYDAGGEYTQMIACRARAVELSTSGPNEYIDYAIGIIQRLRDPVRAKHVLQKIEGMELTDLARSFVALCKGMIAIEEREYAEARKQLTMTLQQVLPYASQTQIGMLIAEVKAYLSIALGALGEKQQAERLLADATPFLTAWKQEELLARCRQAIDGSLEAPEYKLSA